MGGNRHERLACKEPFQSLEVELQRDFGLTPVASRALARRMGDFVERQVAADTTSRSAGQIVYPAVALGERAGKPIRHCLRIPVGLTLLHSSDADVLHEVGTPALRRVRLSRLCFEAYRQGAVLSHEDLSLLLCLDLSTIRRLISTCCVEGERPPTRGSVEDIGPGVSHKETVIKLFFRGFLPAGIAARSGHSLGSVERYLGDFARVVRLRCDGFGRESIVRITGLSPRVITSYFDLHGDFDSPAHAPVFEQLLRRFGPIDADRIETGESNHE